MILVCLCVQLIMSLFLLLAFKIKIISTYKTLMYLCVRMRAHAWMYVFGLIFFGVKLSRLGAGLNLLEPYETNTTAILL